MGTECYALVRGSVIRVTGLNRRGMYSRDVSYAVSKSVSKITINEVVESGANEVVRTELTDERRLRIADVDRTIRYLTDIDFIRVDPGVLSLVAGVPMVTNAAGDVVGFDSNSKMTAVSFALEVWSKLDAGACRGLGFGEMEFGADPFGDGSFERVARPWGYSLFPFLKGGILSGFAFSNGLVSFNLRSAQTRRMSPWGYGPYVLGADGERLDQPVSGNTLFRQTLVVGTPPVPGCGVQIVPETIIDGGTATITSDDILDGGTALVTSPDTVDGGTAL